MKEPRGFAQAAEANRLRMQQQYDARVPKSIKYPERSCGEWMDEWSERQPEAPYLLWDHGSMTYGESARLSAHFAGGLKKLGVRKGDRVALVLPNVPAYLIALRAIWKLGAVEVPANPRYTFSELRYQLNDSGTETAVFLRGQAEVAGELLRDAGCTVRQIILVDTDGNEGTAAGEKGVWSFQELLQSAVPSQWEPVFSEDLARLQYTSGTTGTPKGCMITHGMIVQMGARLATWVTDSFERISPQAMRTLAALPLYHIYGFQCTAGITVCTGSSVVLTPNPQGELLLEAIERFQPNFATAVPALLQKLLSVPRVREKQADFSSLHGIFTGSAPCSVELLEQWKEKTGVPLTEGYGMSEGSGVLTVNPMQNRRPGTVGVAIPDTEILIVDPKTGRKVMPAGEPGELICRGSQVMSGYWNRPEETAEVLRNGWLYTGDIAVMDADGFLTIRSRKKEMMIVSGFNVYPKEIDEIMLRHPEVSESYTLGIPDAVKGEVPMTFAVLRREGAVTAAELENHLRRFLTPYKIPTGIVFCSQLPKNSMGKVNRPELKRSHPEIFR